MLDKSTLEQETQNAIEWIKVYVEKTKANGIVIGNSGGKDSSTVLAMAVKAIGKEKVDLSNTYQEMENEINGQIPQSLTQEAIVNMKPRLRMTTLYSIAQTLGYLVIGTGNLCEAMVGYTTKWGDNSSDFNPIGNFTVEEVLAIGKMLGVPEKILQKAPSDGLGGQTDEEKMGIQYSQVEEMIETGTTDEMAKQEIIRRYQVSKHKRRTVPIYTFERKNYLLEL